MLQIRLSLPEFSNGVNFSDPIIMDQADAITLSKAINSSDESINFEIPLGDPKISYVNYLRWWECYDTETNLRLNYGPIRQISRGSGDNKKVQGPGRSSLLEDYYKSVQTFYYPINIFLDDLRYESLTAEPRTSTIININTSSDYYGISKRSKDLAIDEQTGYIAIGRDTPVKGQKKTDSFWAGTGKADYLIVDLGEDFYISKARVLLPWWGGSTINNERSYDWQYLYSSDNTSYTQVFTTAIPNHSVTDPTVNGKTLYFGESGYEFDVVDAAPNSILSRYWKLNISDTHAYYGVNFVGISSTKIDAWDWECNGSNIFNGITKESPFLGEGGKISKVEVTPPNDCYASAVELAFYKKILGKDTISNLSYKQIQDDNRQITYYHVPDASEMITTDDASIRKYEPGTFFRNVTFTTSSNVTITDEYNTILYVGGSGSLKCPAYTRMLKFAGSSDSQVVYVDTWQGKRDAFSYGGSYSYTTVQNDYAILHFRGVSVKLYTTIPPSVTPGQVSIELQSLDAAGVASGWTTLVSNLTLPIDVAAYKVWEITPESGLLQDNTTYELRITNLNGGYVGIDSFTGYWSGSFSNLSEDDARWYVRFPQYTEQLYGQKFAGGSIYELKDGGNLTREGISFVGDRIIVYSRKGPKYGLIQFAIGGYPIPGGDADGSFVVDLNSPHEIPQAVVFDSNDYFTSPTLPWGKHNLGVYKPESPLPVWLDGVGIHETTGLSVKFLDTSYLDVLKSTAEALQMEWDVTELGLKVVPRLGVDTDVIFAEGRGTTIKIEDVEDVSQMATMLVTSGADIDGLPLSAIVENKNNKKLINRTVQRLYDLRNVGDYFTLIGAARTELLRRNKPQRRITVTTINLQGVSYGDSFIVKDADISLRARATQIVRTQSSNAGTQYVIECLEWPQIT